MTIKKVLMAANGPEFSEIVQGYWRMGDWGMNTQEYLSFLKSHVELGITTVDHATFMAATLAVRLCLVTC